MATITLPNGWPFVVSGIDHAVEVKKEIVLAACDSAILDRAPIHVQLNAGRDLASGRITQEEHDAIFEHIDACRARLWMLTDAVDDAYTGPGSDDEKIAAIDAISW